MSDRLLVSTKKGLFALVRRDGGWTVQSASFLGENVTLAHADHAGGWFAALNLGHFGAKLKFSPDGGKTWEDRAVPAYPEGETFAAPMTHAGDDHLPQLTVHWPLEAGRVTGREQTTMVECDRGECDVHGELWFQPMAQIRTRGANRKVAMRFEESAFFSGLRIGARRARQNSGMTWVDLAF